MAQTLAGTARERAEEEEKRDAKGENGRKTPRVSSRGPHLAKRKLRFRDRKLENKITPTRIVPKEGLEDFGAWSFSRNAVTE